MKKKSLLLRFLPFIAMIGLFLFFYIKGKRSNNRFYSNKSNSIVIDSSTWQQRTWEYYLSDGLEIHSRSHYDNEYEPGEIDINVGDSIVKQAKSWEFVVYKKDYTGKYQYHNKYMLSDYWK